MKFLKIFFLCRLMRAHDWTSLAVQGAPLKPEQLHDFEAFWNHARTYCSRCNKESQSWKEARIGRA